MRSNWPCTVEDPCKVQSLAAALLWELRDRHLSRTANSGMVDARSSTNLVEFQNRERSLTS